MKKKFSVITLGCAKNEVDSEYIIGILKCNNFEYVSDLKDAQIIIINTCSFLESSISESLDTIFSVSELKKHAKLKTLIVTGCLIHRYKHDLVKELPEVDIFLSSEEYKNLPKILEKNEKGIVYKDFSSFLGDEKLPRIVSTPSNFAYIKIAEGCSHNCSYCIIPKIKGRLQSRSIKSIVLEAKRLSSMGVKEINLVAQDLTSFGKDSKNKENLELLVDELYKAKIPVMFRLLYLYPTGVTDSLLSKIIKYENFYNYIDLPLQHSSKEILQKMKRPVGKYLPDILIKHINEKFPTLNIRTTFIVGYPNETKKDFENLKKLISKGYFASVGFFAFSMEEGTGAFKEFPDFKLDKKEVKKRIKELEIIQQKVRLEQLRKLKGDRIRVFLESVCDDSNSLLVGRSEFQAPDVDGRVYINDVKIPKNRIMFGNFYSVRVKSIKGYNIIGTIEDKIDNF